MFIVSVPLGDAAKFYVTPITTTTPFEELIRMPDLPPNLHVQKEPFRFTEGIIFESLHHVKYFITDVAKSMMPM